MVCTWNEMLRHFDCGLRCEVETGYKIAIEVLPGKFLFLAEIGSISSGDLCPVTEVMHLEMFVKVYYINVQVSSESVVSLK